MEKQTNKVSFSFENPNQPEDLERVLLQLLTQKLLSRQGHPEVP